MFNDCKHSLIFFSNRKYKVIFSADMQFSNLFLINHFQFSHLQNRFDNLFRKYITYTGGEELFGLPVTQHPQLLDIRKQLALLQKLYGLYNSVIETVNGYNDILWADIHIEKINNELLDFQTRSKQLFTVTHLRRLSVGSIRFSEENGYLLAVHLLKLEIKGFTLTTS